MKNYDDMDIMEKADFLALAHGVLTEIRAETRAEQAARPALVVLWTMGHNRAVRNLWTHYDVDPNGFIDEAIRKGMHFIEQLIDLMDKHPPPPGLYKPEVVRDLAEDGRKVAHIMGAAAYRPTVVATFEDFFRQSREEGHL